MFIYVVNAGDTLSSISRRFNVTQQSIIDANVLVYPNNLLIGQSLLIPSTDFYYQVKAGDTLYKISNEYGVSVNEIARVNGVINPDVIDVGQILYLPGVRTIRTETEVNGYTYDLGTAAKNQVQMYGDYLTYFAPFSYLITETGGLQGIDDSPSVNEALAENILPMMVISNFTSQSTGANLVNTVLSSDELTFILLENIIGVMNDKGYAGLNIDFENVLPGDRELYNSFIVKARDRVKREGYFISSALAPKISANQTGLLYSAHDYAFHGQIMDFVILMTYEWGYRKGPARAISPINEIRRVIEYALTEMPAEKIMMGFQILARDWILPFVPGSTARTYSCQEAIRIAVEYNVEIKYDTLAQSPFFNYTDASGRRHEVWFEDARSAKAKFNLVKKDNLRGISYWTLSFPFPQNYTLLENEFNIKKIAEF